MPLHLLEIKRAAAEGDVERVRQLIAAAEVEAKRTPERKSITIKAEAIEGRTIKGYGSTFEDPEKADSYGDIIKPGAWLDSIAKHEDPNDPRSVKLLEEHKTAIGLIVTLKEDDKGLWMEATIPETRRGDEALELARAGVYDGLSVGFYTRGVEWVEDVRDEWGYPVRAITKADLVEISLTALPANPFARVEEVRSLRSLIYPDHYRRRDPVPSPADEMHTRALERASQTGHRLDALLGRLQEAING